MRCLTKAVHQTRMKGVIFITHQSRTLDIAEDSPKAGVRRTRVSFVSTFNFPTFNDLMR